MPESDTAFDKHVKAGKMSQLNIRFYVSDQSTGRQIVHNTAP